MPVTKESRVTTLSKSVIESLDAPATGNVVYWDRDVTGLGLRVTASGHCSFVYRYVVSGRERRFTVGDYGQAPGLTVTAAREIVRKRRFTGRDGKRLDPNDPLSTIETDREARTVRELCERCPGSQASRLHSGRQALNRPLRAA
jgi:hypothetical protein